MTYLWPHDDDDGAKIISCTEEVNKDFAVEVMVRGLKMNVSAHTVCFQTIYPNPAAFTRNGILHRIFRLKSTFLQL